MECEAGGLCASSLADKEGVKMMSAVDSGEVKSGGKEGTEGDIFTASRQQLKPVDLNHEGVFLFAYSNLRGAYEPTHEPTLLRYLTYLRSLGGAASPL